MKRIVDTLRPNHDEFWAALVSLKECVYQYKPEDYQALIETLKRVEQGYSDREIHKLRHSKPWHQRYEKYLEKIVFPPAAVARANLTTWFQRFKGWRDPTTDQNMFTVDTKTSFDEQCKNVEFLGNIPEVQICRMFPPGPKSRHGLPQKSWCQPESRLEQFHDPLAHYGNTGMNPGLADCLTLRGTASFNVQIRH
jgi:hypothetical protein